MMDFSRMKYRVDQIPDTKSVVMQYPELAKFAPRFCDQGDMPPALTPDFVMRYLILIYCPGSPGLDEITELNKRKAWALRTLNVEPDANKKLPPHINGLMSFEYQGVVDKAVLLLRLMKNHDWAMLRGLEEKYFHLITQLHLPKADIQEEKVLQQTLELNKIQLKQAKTDFVDGEKARELEEGINQYLAEENLGIDPESYIVEYGARKTVFDGVIP